jgi:hypothetical protein
MRALGIALLATACMPSFESVSDIRDLRVLAVQAEPPEAQFDQNGVQDVTVRALAVDPFPRMAAQVNGRLCAPTDSRRCETGPRQELPSLVGPAGGEFSWVVRVPRAVLDFALGNDTLRGLGGIRVMLSLDVNDGDPHGVLFASKDLLYSPAGGTPNHNPLMTGLQLTRDTSDAGKWSPGDPPLPLSVGAPIGLRPLLAADAIEEYDTTDLRGNKVHLREQLSYSFFTEPGAELDRDGADEPLGGIAPPEGLTRITANRRGGAGKLYVVVRDGRGGESWLTVDWLAN